MQRKLLDKCRKEACRESGMAGSCLASADPPAVYGATESEEFTAKALPTKSRRAFAYCRTNALPASPLSRRNSGAKGRMGADGIGREKIVKKL